MHESIRPNPGSRKKRKRVARGNASGSGTTAGRGTKGQQSRVGKGRRLGFEGGQTPLIRRQPKMGGFSTPRKITYEPINLDTLEAKAPAGTYDVPGLAQLHIVSDKRPVKLLGRGIVTKKFALTVNAASKAAKAAIVKMGGSVTVKKWLNG